MSKKNWFVLVALACMGILTATAGFLLQQGSFPLNVIGPFALVPQKAARDMLNNRGDIYDFNVVYSQPWSKGRLVVHNYSVLKGIEPARFEFGYALVELRGGGWSVYQADLYEALPPPEKVSYASEVIDNTLVVYGRISDDQIKAVEVVGIGSSNSVKSEIVHGGFLVTIGKAQRIQELRLLDQDGNIIEQYYRINLYKQDMSWVTEGGARGGFGTRPNDQRGKTPQLQDVTAA